MIEAVGEQTSLWDRKRRAGQRLIIGISGAAPNQEERELIRDIQPAGFCLFARNIEDPAQVRELNRELTSLVNDATPPLLSLDQEGGRVLRLRHVAWPPMRAVGNLDNPETTEHLARSMTREVRALGFNTNWAPVADVDSNPHNPVIGDRAFSRLPEAVAAHATAFWRGMDAEGCIGAAKHFPGHGDTRTDSHLDLPVVEKEPPDLEHTELVPFRALVEAGVPCVMTAHVVYPCWDAAHPATLSNAIVSGLLRNELGFEGVVVSDDLDMKAVADRFTPEEVVDLTCRATVDLLLCCERVDIQWSSFEALIRLQEQHRAHDDLALDAMTRLKRLRERYFLQPLPQPGLAEVGSRQHTALAEQIRARGLG